jgi:hypothetical protein
MGNFRNEEKHSIAETEKKTIWKTKMYMER